MNKKEKDPKFSDSYSKFSSYEDFLYFSSPSWMLHRPVCVHCDTARRLTINKNNSEKGHSWRLDYSKENDFETILFVKTLAVGFVYKKI